MAPSTPPPPNRVSFAALTIASTASRVMSPSRTSSDGGIRCHLSNSKAFWPNIFAEAFDEDRCHGSKGGGLVHDRAGIAGLALPEPLPALLIVECCPQDVAGGRTAAVIAVVAAPCQHAVL